MTWSRAVREFLGHSILARVGFAAAAMLLVAALFAPWITPADPAAQNLPVRLASPSRAQVLKVKELEFILAARSLGASHMRIMMRHLLPNILQPVLIQATIGMAGAILAESTLSFLGLGVLAPVPSWGAMLNDARGHLFDAPHMVVFPALAVMVAVLSFNLLGDAWRDWLDPRTRAELEVAHLSR